MPSRSDASSTRRRGAPLAAIFLATMLAAAASPSAAAAATSAAVQSPTRPGPADVAAVEAAASSVRADPDLGGFRKERTWQLKKRDNPAPPSIDPFWLELARWLAEGGRWLMWLLGAAVLAVALVTARRWLAVHGDAIRSRGARLPSHVRELDIRPESLPADIGIAVRELWLAGERRPALSLLYRGALSRLVHSYEVAIGDASTEGDCVRLARDVLPPERSDFVATLIGSWQLAVYGDRALRSDDVLRLCADFDRMLPALASAPSALGR